MGSLSPGSRRAAHPRGTLNSNVPVRRLLPFLAATISVLMLFQVVTIIFFRGSGSSLVIRPRWFSSNVVMFRDFVYFDTAKLRAASEAPSMASSTDSKATTDTQLARKIEHAIADPLETFDPNILPTFESHARALPVPFEPGLSPSPEYFPPPVSSGHSTLHDPAACPQCANDRADKDCAMREAEAGMFSFLAPSLV